MREGLGTSAGGRAGGAVDRRTYRATGAGRARPFAGAGRWSVSAVPAQRNRLTGCRCPPSRPLRVRHGQHSRQAREKKGKPTGWRGTRIGRARRNHAGEDVGDAPQLTRTGRVRARKRCRMDARSSRSVLPSRPSAWMPARLNAATRARMCALSTAKTSVLRRCSFGRKPWGK